MLPFENTAEGLQDTFDLVSKTLKLIRLTINSSKTKKMAVNQSGPYQIILDNKPIENVDEFKYLGFNLIPGGGTGKDISVGISKA